MAGLRNVLIIGGGIGGMCAAIELRKRGIPVDLVEIDPEWRVYGAGITISGAALRAFKAIGVLDQIRELGSCTDGCDICDPSGRVVAELPTPRIAGPDIPGSGGILRPVLARILSTATRAAGVQVRLGVSFSSLSQTDQGVDVTFTDGSRSSYDLVVGADGLNSKVRSTVFDGVPHPEYTGQGCWRALVPRVPSITRASMFMGRATKAGLNLVSKDEMYLFCLDHREVNARIPEEQWPAQLTALLAEFGGAVGELRDGLNQDSRILYRPLESVLLPPPWHRQRVVLIGDAAHATTPHLASGAAISVEDALVLVEELSRAQSVAAGLDAYAARRYERCRMVVQNSLRLGEIEITGGSKEEHAQVMRDSMRGLLEPI